MKDIDARIDCYMPKYSYDQRDRELREHRERYPDCPCCEPNTKPRCPSRDCTCEDCCEPGLR